MENVDKVKGAVEAIAKAETNDELNNIIEVLNGAIKEKQRSLQAEIAKTFSVGDFVRFYSKKEGVVEGTIFKINVKTIKLETKEGDVWNVSPNLLDKVS
jgi:polyribonucleotide nucleotidyltransferase